MTPLPKPTKRRKRRNLKWSTDADLRSKSRKELVAILDTVFSQFIRKRDKACVLCGKREPLQCGHLFSRVAYSTRWDEVNCAAVCPGCNMRHEYDAFPHTKWAQDRYGILRITELHERYNTPRKFKDHELVELILKYAK